MLFLYLLLGLNLILVALLIPALKQPPLAAIGTSTPVQVARLDPGTSRNLGTAPNGNAARGTPFTQMYSSEPRKFAANLRAIHCPEQTVKDIIVAEISRRYKAQEEALRPKPADHVPIGWSSSTSEDKLLQRRHEAISIAREKAALIQEALGYGVPVGVPLYAMTAADERLEGQLANLPENKRNPVRQAQDDYWVKVQALHERTKGFWQSEDLAELDQLKGERQETIQKLLNSP